MTTERFDLDAIMADKPVGFTVEVRTKGKTVTFEKLEGNRLRVSNGEAEFEIDSDGDWHIMKGEVVPPRAKA